MALVRGLNLFSNYYVICRNDVQNEANSKNRFFEQAENPYETFTGNNGVAGK